MRMATSAVCGATRVSDSMGASWPFTWSVSEEASTGAFVFTCTRTSAVVGTGPSCASAGSVQTAAKDTAKIILFRKVFIVVTPTWLDAENAPDASNEKGGRRCPKPPATPFYKRITCPNRLRNGTSCRPER